MKRTVVLTSVIGATVALAAFLAFERYEGRDQLMAEGLRRQIETELPANASQSDVLAYLGSIGATARVTTADEFDSVTAYNGIEPGTPGVRAILDQEGTWFIYPDRHFELFVVLKDGVAQRVVVEEYSFP